MIRSQDFNYLLRNFLEFSVGFVKKKKLCYINKKTAIKISLGWFWNSAGRFTVGSDTSILILLKRVERWRYIKIIRCAVS
ncbi:MAG TPA: hypothetical protein VK712_01975 [Verrucomicrobiae bacterium]|jgi:hypothetical protein|nr:hypothetical protein [Verrucomicrobiae bacterium]